MNFNNFTIKSQEAVQKAVDTVKEKGQQSIETSHLLMGVIMTGENVVNFLFQKLGVNLSHLVNVLNNEIESFPRVSGGEPYLSRESNAALDKATSISKQMGDQYVSLEHILLGILTTRNSSDKIMKDAGISENELKSAIAELRKGNKVDSQSAEDTYQSLEKYAINLTQRAKDGKLDPVIGRDEEIRRVLQILSRLTNNNPILIG